MCFIWMSVALEYQAVHKGATIQIRSRQVQLNVFILRIVFFILWFMAAFRAMDITNDTAAYYRTYENIARLGFAGEIRMEKGYVALNVLLSHLFSNNLTGFHVLLFITTLISYPAVEQWIERHADTYGICIVAFYFLRNGSFMSAIRQSMAVGIVLWALIIWEDIKGIKKYLLYYALVAVAVLFHQSAVVAISFPVLARLRYTRSTTILIMFLTAIATATNFVSVAIRTIGINTGSISEEIGNSASAGVMSLLYLSLLVLRLFSTIREEKPRAEVQQDKETESEKAIRFGNSFFTYGIALSLAVSVMSLRAPNMNRLNMYFQTVGLPYISNVLSGNENPNTAFTIKIVFASAVWAYSLAALILRPEWQHLWPYHFYWE